MVKGGALVFSIGLEQVAEEHNERHRKRMAMAEFAEQQAERVRNERARVGTIGVVALRRSRMIVDLHVHIFRRLDGFTGAGRVRPLPYGMVQIGEGRPFRLLPPALERTNFPAEILLEYMAAAGVDRAVLMQGPLYGDMNDYYAEVLLRWPDQIPGRRAGRSR